ncbi:MAG: hypothetical protein F6K11_17035 [Leptolyngbya sp. SIO3F4]|nr:hypothetical protein [Leptolyngbya sp. SIO3F4]
MGLRFVCFVGLEFGWVLGNAGGCDDPLYGLYGLCFVGLGFGWVLGNAGGCGDPLYGEAGWGIGVFWCLGRRIFLRLLHTDDNIFLRILEMFNC